MDPTRSVFVVSVLSVLPILKCTPNAFENYYLSIVDKTGEELHHIWDETSILHLEENADQLNLTCLEEDDVLSAYAVADDTNVTAAELIYLCPAILYRALVADKCAHGHEESVGNDASEKRGYQYGTLAVFICSITTLLGIPVVLLKRDSLVLKLLLQLLIALAMSTMSCDSVLHLWPMAMGLHGHEEETGHGSHGHEEGSEEEGHDRTYLWRSLAIIGSLYAFYLIEALFHHFTSHTHGSVADSNFGGHGLHGTINNHTQSTQWDEAVTTEFASNDAAEMKNEKETPVVKKRFGIPEDKFTLVMLITIGDAFCNFVDGLAVGAAFVSSRSTGVSTSIAVFCHEVPYELGDFAILFHSDLGLIRILLFNLFSASFAFSGLYIGVFLSEHGFYEWILAFTTGMFLYIAFIDLFPQLVHSDAKYRWTTFAVQNCGLIIGFVIMLLLALYEEDI